MSHTRIDQLDLACLHPDVPCAGGSGSGGGGVLEQVAVRSRWRRGPSGNAAGIITCTISSWHFSGVCIQSRFQKWLHCFRTHGAGVAGLLVQGELDSLCWWRSWSRWRRGPSRSAASSRIITASRVCITSGLLVQGRLDFWCSRGRTSGAGWPDSWCRVA